MSTYWEKLKDPRWQEKRLRVMERAGFKCEHCRDKTTTLNVHHTYYERGNDPWDYPAESLLCLCENCHEEAEAVRLRLVKSFGRLAPNHQLQVLGFAEAMFLLEQPEGATVQAGEWPHTFGLVANFSLERQEVATFANQLDCNVAYSKNLAVTAQDIREAITLKREFNAMDARTEADLEDERLDAIADAFIPDTYDVEPFATSFDDWNRNA